ncbi:hypothetical protein DFP73DRAFT_629082 [Morchella snyderi]|nr:hypothetical protein DFP73DRAFT_629082 [Morchella snyderi]
MAFSDTPPLPSTDWDILITGSGIKQSLLAVALSRAGKTVLQTDRNSYYGGASTAFYTPSELSTWAARVNSNLEPGFSRAELAIAADAELARGFTVSLAPHLVYWDSALLRLLRGAALADAFAWQAVGAWWVWLTDAEVAVPAPAGSGAAMGSELLMGAGVTAAKAVAAGRRRWNKGRKTTPAGGSSEDKGAAAVEAAAPPPPLQEQGATALRRMGGFREVACTFEDVAWSADLSDRDRGHLGEFLRFVMKHDSHDPADQKYRDIFTEYNAKPLQTLLTTLFPLPPAATASLCTLTLLPTPPAATPLARALPALARHFRSLGCIPDARSAAALTLAYGGSAELCQVLSRAAAVAGGVNVLGRGVSSIATAEKQQQEEEKGEGAAGRQRRYRVALDNGEEIGVDWIIGCPADLPPSPSPSPSPSTPRPTTATGEQPQTPAPTSRAAYILTGTLPALLRKKHADEAVTPAAAIAVVPIAPTPTSTQPAPAPTPATDGSGDDAVPVYIQARSWVTGECPRGHTLLYASTVLGYDAIRTAVARLLQCQQAEEEGGEAGGPPAVLLSLFYTCTATNTAATADAGAGSEEEGGGGVVHLDEADGEGGAGGLGMVFDDGAVDEARALFVRVVGAAEGEGGEGFMRLPEEARRMLEEMEEA